MRAVPLEVFMAAGYAAFLVAVAAVLERVAKNSRRRTDQLEIVVFRYHPERDRWECPAGGELVRISTHEHRVARYRAPAHTCNACRIKNNCTDSDRGREIEHHLDLWIQAGIDQFHGAVSLALLVLAGLLLAIEAARYPQPRTLLMITGMLAPIVLLCLRVSRSRVAATVRTSLKEADPRRAN